MSENKTTMLCGIEHKIDQRPKRDLWAPGNYSRECTNCQSMYIGDKRSWLCADCAYQVLEREKMEWVCTVNSVNVKDVYCIHKNDNIMLLVVETGTKYPTAYIMDNDQIFLYEKIMGKYCGASTLSITLPDGFKIWSADAFEASVRLTVIRTTMIDYTAV